MENYLAVFIGGGIGSLLRFSVAQIPFQKLTQFPVNTLMSNSLAGLILGIVAGLLIDKEMVPLSVKLFFITGLCGGFSTYSAFTFETIELYKMEKYLLAFSNIFLNFALCTVCILAGMMLVKLFR